MKSKENQWKSTHVLDSWKIYDYLSTLEFKERTILPKGKTLVHYDFYRLKDPGLMIEDLEENLNNKNNIIVIG